MLGTRCSRECPTRLPPFLTKPHPTRLPPFLTKPHPTRPPPFLTKPHPTRLPPFLTKVHPTMPQPSPSLPHQSQWLTVHLLHHVLYPEPRMHLCHRLQLADDSPTAHGALALVQQDLRGVGWGAGGGAWYSRVWGGAPPRHTLAAQLTMRRGDSPHAMNNNKLITYGK